jgi:hypothetical protein
MGWLGTGMKLFPLVVDAIQWVEKFIKGKGKTKQDAAVAMVKAGLGLVESAVGKDLLNDSEVETATRRCIDAIVALQNVIDKKHGAG